MSLATYKIIPEKDANTINYSRNFRIFTVDDAIEYVTQIVEVLETIGLGSAEDQYLMRSFRYSKDKKNWSLWYEFVPGEGGSPDVILDLSFDPSEKYYFQFKYEYDDNTMDMLAEPITINEIKIRLNTKFPKVPLSQLTPAVTCSDEKCPLIVVGRDHSFQPYEVGSAVGLNKDLSFFVNKIYGLDVVYFRTAPDLASGDYIFKEWVIYKVKDMKCIKVMVENNEFPDSKPHFMEEGLDYEPDFEIEIDKRYFESMFCPTAEPRKKDFLYFPLVNRMYEIQGSYAVRSIMMQPLYYKVKLVKFRRNINYLMEDEPRNFLDNILLDSEQLFEDQVQADIDESLMPEQFKTITEHADESRAALDEKLGIIPYNFYFNYASLIENYYNLSNVDPGASAVEYKQKPILDDDNLHMSYSTLFNIRGDDTALQFLYGGDGSSPNYSNPSNGIALTGSYSTSTKRLMLNFEINGELKSVRVNDIDANKWYGMFVSVTKEFGQIGFFIYEFVSDSGDPLNNTDINLKYEKALTLDTSTTFSIDDPYKLLGSNLNLANIRLFNRVLKQEDHMFIMSQLFIKDESMLYFIDNSRPRLGVPFLSRNR